MHTLVAFALFFLVGVPGVSCARVPDHFLTGKNDKYPTERYLTGVGQGADLSEAQSKAFASIGAQVSASIEAVLISDEQTVIRSSSDERPREEMLVRVKNSVRQTVRFDPEGLVRIADSYTDSGIVYVFAVLEKAAAAAHYRAQAERLRAQTAQCVERFEQALSEQDLRGAAAAARDVREPSTEIARLLLMSEALVGARTTRAVWEEELAVFEIPSRLRTFRSSLEVQVCVTQKQALGDGELIRAELTNHLAGAGFRVQRCGTPKSPDAAGQFRVEATLDARFVEEPALEGIVFCLPRVALRVSDTANPARQLLAAEIGGTSARAAGRDERIASQAATKKLASQILARLDDLFGE